LSSPLWGSDRADREINRALPVTQVTRLRCTERCDPFRHVRRMRLERQPVPQARRRPRIPSSRMYFSKSDARHHPVRSCLAARVPSSEGAVYTPVSEPCQHALSKNFSTAPMAGNPQFTAISRCNRLWPLA